ncbi:hypothetical protein G9A89_016777 [Geosiphon pyriformis]|nr:hypothetical protein G9A89_016777 [Geosiphon pyriformis]
MRICHYCDKQGHLQFECRKRISDQRSVNHSISTRLPTYNAANILNTNDVAIILTSSLSASSSNLSTAVLTQLSAAVSDKLSAPTTSNTTTELTLKQNSKTEINTAKLEIVNATQPSGSRPWNLGTRYAQNPNSRNYLSLLVTPEDASPNNLKTNQKQSLTNNIPPATVINNESLAAIFPFKLEKTTPVLLFSEAVLDTKPITTMYTNVKVDGHFIKLILDSESAGIDCTASARIITADGATKTPISEIDDFFIEVNSIIIPIKVFELQISQNGQHTCVPAICGHFTTTNSTAPLIEFEEEKEKPTWEAYQNDNNRKGKKREELTWNADQNWETYNNQDELSTIWK